MNDAVLETGRLILRRFRDTDLAPWMAHMNTLAVRADCWGQGYASEAAGSLLGAIFTRFGPELNPALIWRIEAADWPAARKALAG